MMRSTIGRLLLLGLTFILSSCFEVREEIWIDALGGGRMQFDYVLPRSAVAPIGGAKGIRREVDAILEAAPELRLDQFEVTETADEFLVHAMLSADSMLSLVELPEREAFQDLPPAATKLAGTFDFKISGSDILFNRQIDIGSALGLAALLIPEQDRANRRTTYIIHLPAAAKLHNATRTEDDGRTLIWDQTLGEAISGPTAMNFVAPLPIPWGWIIAAVVILVAFLLLLIQRFRKRRALREAN